MIQTNEDSDSMVSFAPVFGDYSQGKSLMNLSCFYKGMLSPKRAKRRLLRRLSINKKSSASSGVCDNNLERVYFNSEVDTEEALEISSCPCCMCAT